MSEIVGSLKTYSFLGQAPGREADVVEGIESTLVMLRSKLWQVHAVCVRGGAPTDHASSAAN